MIKINIFLLEAYSVNVYTPTQTTNSLSQGKEVYRTQQSFIPSGYVKFGGSDYLEAKVDNSFPVMRESYKHSGWWERINEGEGFQRKARSFCAKIA